MANVSFRTGSYAQYTALGTYDPSTLYFISEGAIYKGNVNCTDQVVIVETLPQTLVGGKIYIEKDSGKVTYYDGTTSTVVIPATVGSIGDSTPDTDLANVKAIKEFVAAEIAKIPAQVDYTVIVDDSKTSRRFLKDMLASAGHEVVAEAVNGQEGIDKYFQLQNCWYY